MSRISEIHERSELDEALRRPGRFDCVVQGVDLRDDEQPLLAADLGAGTFIGCQMSPALLAHAIGC